MNNKINTSDLAEMLVEKYGFEKKMANTFVKEFQKTIVEGLEKDKIVKINGLGTFKLILIAERKSVNVQTGEAIIIPQHYKVSFVADNTTKTRLNTITSDTEKTDPLKKMAEQANEINDILKDFNNKKNNETEENNPPKEEVINEKTIVVPQKETNKKEKDENSKKNYKWLIWTTIVCLLLMALGFVYYLYSEDINKLFQTEEPTIIIEEVLEENETDPKEDIEETVFSQPINYSEILTIETIRKGTRLAFFAKQYYGHPDFWVYIYEANKDIIENPSNILIGTQVNIPKLPAELIDTTNEDAINHAINLAKKIKNEK